MPPYTTAQKQAIAQFVNLTNSKDTIAIKVGCNPCQAPFIQIYSSHLILWPGIHFLELQKLTITLGVESNGMELGTSY